MTLYTEDEFNFRSEEVARFQHLFPNLNWLMSGRTSGHQKLVPTFPWIDNCLMVTELIPERTSSASMSLRSSSRTLLHPKFTRTNYGARAFSASAPAIWNELLADFNFSDSLNIFKKRLKTFLLNCAFN